MTKNIVMHQGNSKGVFGAGIYRLKINMLKQGGSLGKDQVLVVNLGCRRSSFAPRDYEHQRTKHLDYQMTQETMCLCVKEQRVFVSSKKY